MNKALGPTAKRNRIANYMDAFPEEFEVLEDNLGEANPSIRLQTKSRIINLICDNDGLVKEDFSMIPGAGSKSEYLAKQEAYMAVNKYYNDYYTGAKIIRNSFDDGEMKLELADRTVILKYDSTTKNIEEKDRAKSKITKISKGKNSTKQEVKNISTKAKETKPEYEQLSLFDLPEKTVKNSYEKWPDGVEVINICNNKKYRVKHDDGNIIEVFDNEHGYLIMARADLKVAFKEDM